MAEQIRSRAGKIGRASDDLASDRGQGPRAIALRLLMARGRRCIPAHISIQDISQLRRLALDLRNPQRSF